MSSIAPAISPTPFTNFGELLRYLRRRAYLTQRDLGVATGYSESQICRLEQNQRLPDAALMTLFVPALDLTQAALDSVSKGISHALFGDLALAQLVEGAVAQAQQTLDQAPPPVGIWQGRDRLLVSGAMA